VGEADEVAAGSLARCVEHLLGEPRGEAPSDHEALGEWLASRGLVRVSVAEPAGFAMAGRFLARYEGGWAVVFGVPPGPLYDPLEIAKSSGPPLEASVIAPLELRTPRRSEADPGRGLVRSIAIAPSAEAPMRPLERATAIAGRGLDGDRYARGEGTFSTRAGTGRALTLVDAAALTRLRANGVALEDVESRRNLVVEGIELDALIGRRFRVGEIECQGARRCEPCAHLERLTRPGVLRGLVHRGGLRADVLAGGVIQVGDEIVAVD